MTNWYNHNSLYQSIADFLKKYDLAFCPRSPFYLCKELGIGLIPYKDTDRHLVSLSNDGFSVNQDGRYYIFYNKDAYSRRITFTLAHDLGHIVLKHHELVGTKVLMSGGCGVAEDQANIFARNILMPPQATKALLPFDVNHDQYKYYNVSKEMYDIRIRHLDQDIDWIDKFF